MKKTTLAFCMTASIFAACSNGTTKTENSGSTMTDPDSTMTTSSDKKDKAWVAVDSATEMKAWMEYATPGDQHKMLAKSDGNWTATTTMWMKKGAAPSTSASTMVNKMVLGGRYQMGTYKGNFMGMPFEGISIVAYDNFKKKFVNTWLDNMGTGIMKMEGTWDPDTKSVTYTGSMTCPTNGQEAEMKEIYTIVDDNNHVMEMYGPDSQTGEQYKTMEIKFTRKK